MDRRTFQKIISILQKRYKIKVRREKPFDVLVHGILSTRTKDVVTFPAQHRLFKIADSPEKISKLPLKKIRDAIRPVNYYIGKAKKLRETCKILVEKYGGKVPAEREKLMELPGVGPKVADVVLLFGYGRQVVPVDTHVEVISKRWHIAGKNDKPTVVREKIHSLVPEKNRAVVNQLLVEFGKDICTTPTPKCYMCPVEKFCPYENKNFRQKLDKKLFNYAKRK